MLFLCDKIWYYTVALVLPVYGVKQQHNGVTEKRKRMVVVLQYMESTSHCGALCVFVVVLYTGTRCCYGRSRVCTSVLVRPRKWGRLESSSVEGKILIVPHSRVGATLSNIYMHCIYNIWYGTWGASNSIQYMIWRPYRKYSIIRYCTAVTLCNHVPRARSRSQMASQLG